METQEIKKREIIVKGINLTDHPKVGPKIGIVDREGCWYNSLRGHWSKVPGAWDTLCALVNGDRLEIDYMERAYTAADGSQKTTLDIVSFDKVIQKTDEVKPVSAPKESLPRETPALTQAMSRDDLIAKESAFKSAAEFLKAVGPEVINSLAIIMVDMGNPGTDEYFKIWTDIAHACYGEMMKNW